MNFFIIFLAIGLFVGLFTIYSLGRDDLIFLRKDISMDKLFNIAFIVFFFGLFSSRAFYALMFAPKMFINPLAFLLFPYFPGLSIMGGIIGGIFVVFLYSERKNLPAGRIIDFFSLGLLTSLPIGYFGHFILTGAKNYYSLALSIIFTIIAYFFIKYFYQFLQKGTLKDGSLSLVFFLIFSIVFLIGKIAEGFFGFAFIRQPENYIVFVFLITNLVLFIKQEKIIKTKKR